MAINIQNPYFKRKIEDHFFFFKGKTLYFTDKSGKECSIFEFSDNSEIDDFKIIDIIEYQNYAILFLSWRIYRNILTVDVNEKKLVWQIPAPKVYETNWWRDYFRSEEEPDVVYCRADRYLAGFKISTGEMVYESFSNSKDLRDL